MKYLILISITFLIYSCSFVGNKENKALNKSEFDKTAPNVLFASFVLRLENNSKDLNLELINKIITPGSIKRNNLDDYVPKTGDLKLIFLNKNSNILKTWYVEYPLVRNYEYSDPDGKLAYKTTDLKKNEFFIRCNLPIGTERINFYIYNSMDSTLNNKLLTIDL